MTFLIEDSTLNTARELFDFVVDNSEGAEEYESCCLLRDIFEYTLANNTKELKGLKKLFE